MLVQAVEVRVGPQGTKAKWVRVELKKIETLPGGGQANSYYDHIGSSPIVLWQSSEEYSMLQSVSALSNSAPFRDCRCVCLRSHVRTQVGTLRVRRHYIKSGPFCPPSMACY